MATTVDLLSVPVKQLPQNAEAKDSVQAAIGSHPAILEPKLDGWRLIWKVDATGARSFTRTGNEQTGKMPAIENALEKALPPGTILDGEIVAFAVEDGKIVHKVNRVQNILGSGTAKAALQSGDLTLVVFDLLAHGGIDARPVKFAERRVLLEKLFAQANLPASVILIPQIAASEENYDSLLAGGYEGGMVKWLDAPYRSGIRGGGWFKLKGTATVDAIVVGYKDGQGSFEGLIGAIEFAQYDAAGLLIHRGRCSGMDYSTRKAISAEREGHLGRVFELSHMGVLKPENGSQSRFRHPQFLRFRDDKAAEDVQIHDK